MKINKVMFFTVALLASAWMSTPAAMAQKANLSGTWKAKTTSAQGTAEQTITFQQTGDTFTGEMTTSQGARQAIKDGKIKGDEIEFNVERMRPNGETSSVAYKGKLKGDEISGTFVGQTGRTVEWTAMREK